MMKSRQTRRPLAEINVVPYIDVMLVLLVIFMITAPLLTQGVNVNLPQGHAKALPPNETPIIVSIDQQGNFYLNVSKQPAEPINSQQLMTQIAARIELAQQQHRTPTVYVKGDQNASYGKIAQAMVMLQKAGVSNVGLITQPSHN